MTDARHAPNCVSLIDRECGVCTCGLPDARREPVMRYQFSIDLGEGDHEEEFYRVVDVDDHVCALADQLALLQKRLGDVEAGKECVHLDEYQAVQDRLAVLEQQRIKYGPICLNCGKAEPCMTDEEAAEHGASIPCTFDPAPKVIFDRCKELEKRLAEVERRQKAIPMGVCLSCGQQRPLIVPQDTMFECSGRDKYGAPCGGEIVQYYVSDEENDEIRQQLTDAQATIDGLKDPSFRFGVEHPCKKCNGEGRVLYGSTATWRGGIGGQAMTMDRCNACWGSGDAERPFSSMQAHEQQVARLRKFAEYMKTKRREQWARWADEAEDPVSTDDEIEKLDEQFREACKALRETGA